MGESADIVRYLYKTYGNWVPPDETLRWVSEYAIPLFTPVFQALAPIQAGAKSDPPEAYQQKIASARAEVEAEIRSSPIVIYTYELSPFSKEARALLDSLDVECKEISLGKEWVPGLLAEGGAEKRAALLQKTGQSSLPHVFVGGKSIGGLFSGTPGLVPGLEEHSLMETMQEALAGKMFVPEVPVMEELDPIVAPEADESPSFMQMIQGSLESFTSFLPKGAPVGEQRTPLEEITVDEQAAAIESTPISSLPSFFFEELEGEGESVVVDNSPAEEVGKLETVVVDSRGMEESGTGEEAAAIADEEDIVTIDAAKEFAADEEVVKMKTAEETLLVDSLAVEETAEPEPSREEPSVIDSLDELSLAEEVVGETAVVDSLEVEGSSAEQVPETETTEEESVVVDSMQKVVVEDDVLETEVTEEGSVVVSTLEVDAEQDVEQTESTEESSIAVDTVNVDLPPAEEDATVREPAEAVSPVVFETPPSRPPLKRLAFVPPTDPVKAELVARQLLERRLAEKPAVDVHVESTEEVLGGNPLVPEPVVIARAASLVEPSNALDPTPEVAGTMDPVEAEQVHPVDAEEVSAETPDVTSAADEVAEVQASFADKTELTADEPQKEDTSGQTPNFNGSADPAEEYISLADKFAATPDETGEEALDNSTHADQTPVVLESTTNAQSESLSSEPDQENGTLLDTPLEKEVISGNTRLGSSGYSNKETLDQDAIV